MGNKIRISHELKLDRFDYVQEFDCDSVEDLKKVLGSSATRAPHDVSVLDPDGTPMHVCVDDSFGLGIGPVLSDVGTVRGAPMGRRDQLPDDPETYAGPVILSALWLVDGDYDSGGAYWGCYTPQTGGMYVAWDFEGEVLMFGRHFAPAEFADVVREWLPAAVIYVLDDDVLCDPMLPVNLKEG